MVSALFQDLLGDTEMAQLMGDEATLAAMLRAEAALSLAQGKLGVIPKDAAAAIAKAADTLRPDPAGLAAGLARAGIAAQPLIAALKQAAGDHAAWVHYGATSQDIVDTGLMIQLAQALAQDVGADPRQAPAQVREPPRAQHQLADDQQRPAFPDKVQRMGSGTGIVILAPAVRRRSASGYLF